jgi:hypothetical protein
MDMPQVVSQSLVDTAVDHDRLCVIDAKTDGADTLQRVLRSYNAAKIRNCFSDELLDGIRFGAMDVYRAREAEIASGTVPESAKLRYRRRTILLSELNVAGINLASFVVPSLIVEAARDYLGKEPSQAISSVRAIVPGPDSQSFPFHQDQMILQSPVLNIWIPLTPCGVAAPGLEVAVTSERKLLEVVGSPDDEIPVERVHIDENLVRMTFGPQALWRPAMNVGDALVFTGTTAHRTFVSAEMTDTRISIELRLG